MIDRNPCGQVGPYQLGFISRVFQFVSINLFPTIKKYSRFLGIHYNTSYCDACFFRSRISTTLGIKKSIIDQKGGANECTLNFLCDLFENKDAYIRNNSAFRFFHEEWKRNQVLAIKLVVLGDVLFPKASWEFISDFYKSRSKLNKAIHSSQHS